MPSVPAQADPAAAAACALGAAAAGGIGAVTAGCPSTIKAVGGSAAQARRGSQPGTVATCRGAEGSAAGSEVGPAETEGDSALLGQDISDDSDGEADERRAASRGWLVARVLRLRAAAIGAARGALEGLTDVLITEEGERRAAEARTEGAGEAWAGLGTTTPAGAGTAVARTEEAGTARAEEAGAQAHGLAAADLEVETGAGAQTEAAAAPDSGEFRRLLRQVVGRRFCGMDHLSAASPGPTPSSAGSRTHAGPPPCSLLASANTRANAVVNAVVNAGVDAGGHAGMDAGVRASVRAHPAAADPLAGPLLAGRGQPRSAPVIAPFTQRPPPAAPHIPQVAPSLLVLCCRAVASNTQPLLWAALLANHALDASLLSLPPAVSVLLYAALETPRPARAYSQVLLLYFSILLLLKAAYQVRLVVTCPRATRLPARPRLTAGHPAPTPTLFRLVTSAPPRLRLAAARAPLLRPPRRRPHRRSLWIRSRSNRGIQCLLGRRGPRERCVRRYRHSRCRQRGDGRLHGLFGPPCRLGSNRCACTARGARNGDAPLTVRATNGCLSPGTPLRPPCAPQELTKSFVFVLGLRKYAGLYSLPAGLGLLRAILPELLVVFLLLLDREVAEVTGAYERGASAKAAQHAAAVGRRDEVAKAAGEAKMRLREAGGLPTGEEVGRGGGLGSWPESGWARRLRRQSGAGDDDEVNAFKVETGAWDMHREPGSGGTILRDTDPSAPRSIDPFPGAPAARWWERPSSRNLAGAGKIHASGSGGMGRGGTGEIGGNGSRRRPIGPAASSGGGSGARERWWPAHGLSGFVDRLLVVDFGKSGAALYLASFGVSMTILGWSLFNFSRLSANSSSYSTRCFDPVSGARQSLSASQFDAATVFCVLIAFAVIITDRAIYRIWRPPSASTSGISPDVPVSGNAPNPAASSYGEADSPIRLPSPRGSSGVSQVSHGGRGAPRPRSVALGLKLCLHIGLVCALHAHAFFGPLPAWHCESECASSRMTCERSAELQYFYMLCCMYLLISARQVRTAKSDTAADSYVCRGRPQPRRAAYPPGAKQGVARLSACPRRRTQKDPTR